MAIPYYTAASAGSTDATGAWTHTSLAANTVGDFYVVQVLQDGTAASPAIVSVTNAENLAGTDNVLTYVGEFDVGSAVAASQHIWVGRATATSAMVITGSNAGGDDVYVRVYRFRGVNTGTAISDVIENVTAGSTVNSAGTSATASDASVTTLGLDRLALNLIAVNDDNVIAEFSGETGGDWAFPTSPYAESGGTDGAIGLQVAVPGLLGILDMQGTVSDIVGETGTEERRAQSFSLGSDATIIGITLQLAVVGTPTDNLVVEIQTNSAGAPSGTVVGSGGTIPGSDMSPTVALVRPHRVSLSASLTASTTYWVVVSRSGGR